MIGPLPPGYARAAREYEDGPAERAWSRCADCERTPAAGHVPIADVLAFLVAMEEEKYEEAAAMGCNMMHHDARQHAHGIAMAIDALREEYE